MPGALRGRHHREGPPEEERRRTEPAKDYRAAEPSSEWKQPPDQQAPEDARKKVEQDELQQGKARRLTEGRRSTRQECRGAKCAVDGGVRGTPTQTGSNVRA